MHYISERNKFGIGTQLFQIESKQPAISFPQDFVRIESNAKGFKTLDTTIKWALLISTTSQNCHGLQRQPFRSQVIVPKLRLYSRVLELSCFYSQPCSITPKTATNGLKKQQLAIYHQLIKINLYEEMVMRTQFCMLRMYFVTITRLRSCLNSHWHEVVRI